MARLNEANEQLARAIIARYPEPRSALIPLCHLAQEQDGWLDEDAMAHVAELIGCTPAQVLGTASFYEMFKLHPVGKYCINVCTNISCQLLGGEELLEHAESRLGVRSGGTTPDGMFTLEDVECVAACTEAPAVQVNYRYFHRVGIEDFDALIDALLAGELDDVVPPHGTLAKVRQDLAADRIANITAPEDQEMPVWIARAEASAGEGAAT
ncbi:MAG: NAD(P)H-dependent oxidoreductase subunit E [Microthrixaceae bacterium]|nr:NAD(P)H-dependent oxidoreductase subunit E [Microthrixaceae bacterium]